jgi:hypothetical protein
MSSGYSGLSFARPPPPTYQELLFDADTKYPQQNFLSLKGEIPSISISEMLQSKINLHTNLIDRSANSAESDLHRARVKQYGTQKGLISGAIIEEQNKLQRETQFLKEVKDFSSINFANLSADQARIEGNTKKFLSLGILGAALLG